MKTFLISFWGKGGVGKTTVSLDVALTIARKYCGKKILFFTSDPIPINELARKNFLPENLFFLYIPREEVMMDWKKRFGDEVYDVASSFLPLDKTVINYIAGAPGLSDEFLLYKVMEVWRNGGYDYIVWDTTAAWGSIRLLRIEHEFYSHLTNAIKLYARLNWYLKKIRRGTGDPVKLLEEWKGIAGDVLSMIKNSNHQPYILTIPEPLGYLQTKMILKELGEIDVKPKRIIVNMYLNENVCPECNVVKEKGKVHEKYLDLFIKNYSEKPGVCIIPYIPGYNKDFLIKGIGSRLLKQKCIHLI